MHYFPHHLAYFTLQFIMIVEVMHFDTSHASLLFNNMLYKKRMYFYYRVSHCKRGFLVAVVKSL